VAFCIEAVLLLMTFLYLVQELYQIYREYDDEMVYNMKYVINKPNQRVFFLINKDFWNIFKDHFLQSDIWNVNDIAIIGLVFAGTILRINEKRDIFESNQPTYIPPTSYFNGTIYNPTSQPTNFNTEFHVDSKNVQCVYAVATICVYFKILYFLRPFAASGPLGNHINI
jgi:hypothetical protein